MSIWLVMKTADGGERPFPVRERLVIGRETRCEVRIALPTVSKRHCELVVKDGHVHLVDLESDNGTLHNGSPVKQAVLNHADHVTVGPITFELRIAARDGESGFSAEQTLDGYRPDRGPLPDIEILPRPDVQARPDML